MYVHGAALVGIGAVGAIGGGIAAWQGDWKAPVPPSVGSVEIGVDMALGAAPGAALLVGASRLSGRPGALGAASAAAQVVGAAAMGFGMAAGTVGYFNHLRA